MKLFLLLLIALLFSNCAENEKQYTSFTIKKGVNASHWLSQSDLRGEERKAYMTEKDFEKIAELGFDHVRLPIDEEQMWNENGKKEAEAFQLLHDAINWCFKNNLRVIVDLHVLRSHHFNRPDSRKLWEDSTAQEGFIKFWRQLSDELKRYPNSKLAYEPMNEAVSDNPDDWNNLINWVIKEIRKIEPERTIIMGSNNWQQVGTFKDLRIPLNDKNIILSFHYYEPFLLTHYKAPWTPLKNLTAPVNYPGKLIDEKEFENMDEDLLQFVEGANLEFDKNSIDREIKQAVDIASKHGLKLYCGEFGAFPTTDIKIRAAWYNDMISVFKKYEIAWAHWNYKNDFPLVDENLNPIHELMEILIPKN